jgi:hypothetical protein
MSLEGERETLVGIVIFERQTQFLSFKKRWRCERDVEGLGSNLEDMPWLSRTTGLSLGASRCLDQR